ARFRRETHREPRDRHPQHGIEQQRQQGDHDDRSSVAQLVAQITQANKANDGPAHALAIPGNEIFVKGSHYTAGGLTVQHQVVCLHSNHPTLTGTRFARVSLSATEVCPQSQQGWIADFPSAHSGIEVTPMQKRWMLPVGLSATAFLIIFTLIIPAREKAGKK